ncbi:helix-turn-helix transcriptional regulator [soil metagenome]
MVGRGRHLDRLGSLLEAPGGGLGLVGGEAGIGKSRLLRELRDGLAADVVVLAGQADPGGLSHPFALFLDAVADHVAADDPRIAALRPAGADQGQGPLVERFALARELLAELVGDQRSVLVFEDLHWADSESIALLEQLAAPDTDRATQVLLGSYRPSELSRRHPLTEALPRLERRPSTVHLRIDRFTVDDVRAFLAAIYGGQPSYRVAEGLHARSGGNPFFLEELLVASGGVALEDLDTAPLPWNLAEAVHNQVDGLEPTARATIETAAVLGRRVSFDVLAAVSGLDESELIGVLRSLIGHGLLVETEPDVFGFRHDLSREAIEQRLLGREHRRIHQAALDALHRADSHNFATMARHAQGAGHPDQMVDLARRGSERYVAIGSTYQALELAELGLSEAGDDAELRATAARAAWLAGLNRDAITHAERWAAQAERAEDLEGRSQARRLLMRLYWEEDDQAALAAVIEDMVGDLERLDDGAERAAVLAALAQQAMLRAQVEAALAWAERAVEAAERHGLPSIRRAALVERSTALLNDRIDLAENVAVLCRVAEEADAAGEDFVAARAWSNAAFSSPGLLDSAQRRELLELMRGAALRAGWDPEGTYAYTLGGYEFALYDGDQEEAERWIQQFRQLERRSRTDDSGWLDLRAIGLALERSDVERAQALLAEVVEVGREKAEFLLGVRLAVALAARQPAEVAVHLAALQAKAALDGVDADTLGEFLDQVGEPGLTPADARVLVDGLVRIWGFESRPLAHAERRFLGHIEVADGNLEAGLAHLTATTELSALDLPIPAPHRATDHLGAAKALIGLGRLDEARPHVAAAGELLARWPGWRRDQQQALDRRLGGTSGTSEGAGPPSLTPREREVLALLAEGLSNADLAARLYISPRTAGVHVSNILAKLGVSTRGEAAAWLNRQAPPAP